VWSKVHALSNDTKSEVQSVAEVSKVSVPIDVSHELKREIYTTNDINCKLVKDDNSVEISGLFSSKENLEALKGEYSKVFDNVKEGDIQFNEKSHNSAISKLLPELSSDFAKFKTGSIEYANDILIVDGIVDDLSVKESISNKAESVSYLYVDNKATQQKAPEPVVEKKPEPQKPKVEKKSEPQKPKAEPTVIASAVTKEVKTSSVPNVVEVTVPHTPEVKIVSNEEIQAKLNDLLKIKKVEFVYATAKLTPSGKKTIDEVFTILDDYLNIDVEIGGHTDSDGRASSNNILSLKRADAIREYLITKGIEPTRLKAIGYGESRPLVENNSLANKQINRRVEFKVIGE
jgi:outer membrane protein OmpA-like peptidoglycan-associated protein